MSSNFNKEVISVEDVIKIFKSCTPEDFDTEIKNFSVRRASDKMLGFLADYWKLEIRVILSENRIQHLNFFIKAISKSNAAKANMVREMKLFEKESKFYTVIKNKIITVGSIKPWSANLITTLNEALVFEDLNALQYRTRNKFETFDEQHTLCALQTLARFHAASLLYEEKRSEQLQRLYSINDDHKEDLNMGGYQKLDAWFVQCKNGALEILKCYSKYSLDKKVLQIIENRWADVWNAAIDLGYSSLGYRNVICHRDLWNNNILFHYKEDEAIVPDDCVLVDFQAISYQPPAGDVMLLLQCNLDPKFLEENLATFLNYYYEQLKMIVGCNSVNIEDVISRKEFLYSCEKYRLWALVVSACLVPQFWIDDDITTKIFCNTASFEEVLTKDKASFIKKMIDRDDDYKKKVMQIFEDIADRYCLNDKII